ncbi:MAG: hypothetical protein ACKPJD_13595 [Planctomycetaceae bacterium]
MAAPGASWAVPAKIPVLTPVSVSVTVSGDVSVELAILTVMVFTRVVLEMSHEKF